MRDCPVWSTVSHKCRKLSAQNSEYDEKSRYQRHTRPFTASWITCEQTRDVLVKKGVKIVSWRWNKNVNYRLWLSEYKCISAEGERFPGLIKLNITDNNTHQVCVLFCIKPACCRLFTLEGCSAFSLLVWSQLYRLMKLDVWSCFNSVFNTLDFVHQNNEVIILCYFIYNFSNLVFSEPVLLMCFDSESYLKDAFILERHPAVLWIVND